jgi:hypothetical protein
MGTNRGAGRGELGELRAEVGRLREEVARLRRGVGPAEGTERRRRVHLHAILDASFSMSGLVDATLEGFNGFLARQAALGGTDLVVSLHTFGAPEDFRTVYRAVPAAECGELTGADYVANGMSTALVDAVLDSLAEYNGRSRRRDDADAHVALIITDGHENSSRRRKSEAVALLDALKRTGRWTVAYVGSEAGTWTEAQAYGFSLGTTWTYANTSDGVQSAYTLCSSGLSDLRSTVAAGTSYSTNTFFTSPTSTAAAGTSGTSTQVKV